MGDSANTVNHGHSSNNTTNNNTTNNSAASAGTGMSNASAVSGTGTGTGTEGSGSSKKSLPAKGKGKLNPAAKDYVPQAALVSQEGSSAEPSGSNSNSTNPRNRSRRQGNSVHKSNNNANGRTIVKDNKPSDHAIGSASVDTTTSNTNADVDANTNTNTNTTNSTNNKSKSRRRRTPKQTPENRFSGGGGARIDDDEDDIEINMERPVEPSEEGESVRKNQSGASGSGSGLDRRRERRRKGKGKDKEANITASSLSSSPSPSSTSVLKSHQQSRGENRGGSRRTKEDGANNTQAETSSSNPRRSNNNSRYNNNSNNSSSQQGDGEGSSSNNNNNRRQRNRKTADQGGRAFPSAAVASFNGADHQQQTGESSRPQRNGPRNGQQQQRFVHSRKSVRKAEEDKDLMAALTTGLTNSTYDCMVCWDVIRPAHKIWNCQVCWAAFHLDCLSKWAKKSSEDANNNGTGWRCPGCQNTQMSIPKEYVCFCGKVNNPEFNRYFTPHSCGERCGRSRECPHPCNIPCHPGPCPPCSGLGPIQSCYCGNDTFQLRCVDTDFTFQTGRSCNKVCDELLGCGKHTCSSVCHPGLCPPCEEVEEQQCYCGKHQRQARCGDGEPRTSIVDGKDVTGFYGCEETCNRPLACGNHECTKGCHPLDKELGQCPARPEVVKTCPCGSKSVEVLLKGKTRESCTDPIPVCGGVCKKPLNCGHRCMQKCHLGECSPCRMKVEVNCRCGSTRVQRVCSELGLYGDELPTCDRLCRGLRTCGKHECTNRCCPGKNKTKTGKIDPAALEAHTCPLVCGKKLQCGVHTCEMLCHKGHCNPCLRASFEDLSCACGRTVVQAPIPCGTPIPKCRYSCTRPRACGHTSFSNHPCHPDSEPCPPCIMLVPKECMCKKTLMPNVPCHKNNPSCGKVCGKRLDCNLHTCIKSCHSGGCLSPPTDVCHQPCPKPRKSCGHKCGMTCHGDTPCPEDQPCSVIVPSSCKCGHLTMESACNATTENPWDGKPRIIKCNDYCLIAERNRRVALALEIEEGTHAPGPRIPEYDDYVLDYASASMEFTLKIEKQLAEWVADTSKPILYFPPMKGHRRKFVHELAAHYNVISESVDVEPYRSVNIMRQHNTSVPDLLVSQACRQRRSTGASSSSSGTTNAVEQLRKPTIKDPVNAIYLHDLAFGLTRSELAAQLAPIFGNIKYGIRWLTDDDAVLVPHPGSMQMDELEAVLIRLRTGIKAAAAKSNNLCDRVELCWVNKEGEVVSHTSIGGGSQKRFFNASQGNQWLQQKHAPAKVANTFALLDDDERIAAAKRAEEERILKAKEAAGTLSSDAWDEEVAGAGSISSLPPSVLTAGGSSSTSAESSSSGRHSKMKDDLAKFVVIKEGEFTDEVVDDWQELLDDDDEEEGNKEIEEEKEKEKEEEKEEEKETAAEVKTELAKEEDER
ncbi:FKBP12-associated protein [Lobosporangium transversale]|uniref:R3H domain-containing protein n=1 Tax=Lobosporangium transversale TaxID=64571 RepID=A0A1Y2GP15_9FUNG|nr:hypothetical protein BCR41DRAFT_321867 [Lobosporangium transversale]KAF9914907.1 FKBP12-associated protein [Lobosporangium transversale]ORZ17428.1 hypothetical protein BCR41DRAFT_321867 [Lobosporangium transversale]|eukprot:XP_021881815.1 hypothetical protein BCR41DRAFT_321867 [Lobosporangium transversale]